MVRVLTNRSSHAFGGMFHLTEFLDNRENRFLARGRRVEVEVEVEVEVGALVTTGREWVAAA